MRGHVTQPLADHFAFCSPGYRGLHDRAHPSSADRCRVAHDLDFRSTFRHAQLLDDVVSGHEVEFVTVMWFTSLAAVRAFAGTDYEAAVVPAAARALLRRFDARSAHYDVRERRVA